MSAKPVILVLVQYFLPGYKSGGPVRSIEGLGEHLGGELEFRVGAYDRDSGASRSYPNVKFGCWHRFGRMQVTYVSKTWNRWIQMLKLLRKESGDLLYLQSVFNPCFTLWPLLLRRLSLIPRTPVLLSTRGELSAGALIFKARKKRAFLKLAGYLELFRGVHWQASTSAEAEEIRNSGLLIGGSVFVARNLRVVPPISKSHDLGENVTSPYLRLVFVSRIAPKKQLDVALRILQRVQEPVIFDIYGPLELDKRNWLECLHLIEELPEHVNATWHGPAEPNRISEIFAGADGFLFPTLGENFGHVIAESLLAGCPVLLSDKTPWNDLERAGCGVNLQPDDIVGFATAIDRLGQTTREERLVARERSRQYGIAGLDLEKSVKAHQEMFKTVLGL